MINLIFSENGVFVNSVLSHPSPQSEYFSNYFGLTSFDISILKRAVSTLIEKTAVIGFPNLDGGFTRENLMAYQWLNCSIANDSVKNLNQTTPGFVEYGAYLSEVAKQPKSKLTIVQVKYLLAFNEYTSFDKINNVARYNSNVDDTFSLLNKKNIDDIFSQPTVNDSISFIDKTLAINDRVESTNLYNYINYLSSEMPYRFSEKGTKGIGGISQLVAPYLGEMFNNLGFSLFFNWIKLTSYHNFYELVNCETALDVTDFYPNASLEKICANPSLDTRKMENLITWIDGVLFGNKNLQTLLGCTDIEFTYLTGSNSKLKAKWMFYVNNFMTIYKDYILGTDYRTANFLQLAGLQWVSSKFTKEFNIEKYQTDSVSDQNWDLQTFPEAPEYSRFCASQGFVNEFTYENISPVLSYDFILSSSFLQQSFIDYVTGQQNIFSSKAFINYLRKSLSNVLGGFTMTRPVQELLYGKIII